MVSAAMTSLSLPPPAVPIPVGMLAMANAAMFAIGALLHGGIAVVPVDEPELMGTMMLEAGCALLLVVAVGGMFTDAQRARRWAAVANTCVIVAVIAVAMLLGLDDLQSSSFVKTMQLLRLVFAVLSLLILHHSAG